MNHSFKKFGRQSDFIGCPTMTELIFLFSNPKLDLKRLKTYFRTMNHPQLNFDVESFD